MRAFGDRRLVGEALNTLQGNPALTLEIFGRNGVVRTVSLTELQDFLGSKEEPSSLYFHKLTFEMRTALPLIPVYTPDVHTLLPSDPIRLAVNSAPRLWLKVALAAASLIVMISLGWVFFTVDSRQPQALRNVPATAAKALKTLSTGKGELSKLRLTDGSVVYLNELTTLRYSPSFATGTKREVFLSGEAYFEVAKDAAKPFLVNFKGQVVKVTGTRFNVSAWYNQSSTTTSLLEGSVELSYGNGKDQPLKPGQAAVVAGSTLKIIPTDQNKALAWQNSELVFREEPLENIMQTVSRWYQVQVVYNQADLVAMKLGGTINRKDGLAGILKILEATGDINFTIKGSKVYITERK